VSVKTRHPVKKGGEDEDLDSRKPAAGESLASKEGCYTAVDVLEAKAAQ